jgi:hypothetical protein
MFAATLIAARRRGYRRESTVTPPVPARWIESQPDVEVSVLHWQPRAELPDLPRVGTVALDLDWARSRCRSTCQRGLMIKFGCSWGDAKHHWEELHD